MRVFSDAVVCRIATISSMTVLVAYASRHGATEGIATRIAERIADVGTAVDLRQVDAVESLDAYDTVVFGAPVYDRRGHPRLTGSSTSTVTFSLPDQSGCSASDRLAIRSA